MSPSDLGVFVFGDARGSGGRQCSEMQPNDNSRAGSVHGCTQTACLHAGFAYALSLRPIPQWAALEGCTAVALIVEHDDTRQASRHCARACGALTRVRRACLWRADACAQGVPVAAGGPYVYGSNGDPQEYARIQDNRRREGTHQCSARRRPRSWRQKARLRSRSADSTLDVTGKSDVRNGDMDPHT